MEPISLLFLIGVLVLVALVSGIASGLFGIGGGAVMVPTLHYAFKAIDISDAVVMHCAVATSAAVMKSAYEFICYNCFFRRPSIYLWAS